jgi:hypothetical protein
MRVGYQKRTIAGDKTICPPVPDGVDYDIWIKDHVGFRQYLDEQICIHPELFPPAISTGYQLIGFVESKKQPIKTRRLMVKDGSRQCYQIRPDTMMPYTEDLTTAYGEFAQEAYAIKADY